MDTDDTESWTVEWEDHHKAPYMHKGVKWVSYDDQESIRIKSHFAYQHGLAGVMTWSIDTDDFRGKCGGPTYPLLRTINNALYEKENGYSASTRGSSPMVSLQIMTSLFILGANARIWGRLLWFCDFLSDKIFSKTTNIIIHLEAAPSPRGPIFSYLRRVCMCTCFYVFARSRTIIVFFVPKCLLFFEYYWVQKKKWNVFYFLCYRSYISRSI